MGTALLDEDVVWGGESGVREDVLEGESEMEALARRLRRKGYDAVAVYEGDEELNLREYLGEKTLKYLDAIELDENGRGGNA